MSMFPGPGAQVYYNEAGEPLGWDYPSYGPPEPDDDFVIDDRDIDEVVCRTCKDWFFPDDISDVECEDCVAAANEHIE